MNLPIAAAAVLFALSPTQVDSIQLTALDGSPVSLPTAGKITAVVFVSVQCPVSNDYNERMKALYADYSGRGVQLAFVNANSTESAEAIAAHAKAQSFPFRVYKDNENVLADRLGAEFTPHAFIIGKDSQVIYRGAIDDSRSADKITHRHLREALDAALAGQALPASETKAFGCSIKRAKKAS